MAAVNVVKRNAVTLFGIESSYGTTPSMTRATVKEGSFEIQAAQTEIAVDDERAHLADLVAPVRGLKTAPVKFGLVVRAPAAQISAAGSASTHYLGIPLKATFGAESVSGGDTLSAAASETSVTATTIARYAVGQWFLVTVAGTTEPVRIGAISGSDITLSLGASATPTAGATFGMSNWYLAQTNTQSMTVQHSPVQDTALQWTANGCTGSLSFKTERDALIEIGAELKAASWTGPSSQSISVAAAAESMGSPFAMRDYTCILQATGTATRAHYHIDSVEYEFQFGMEHVPELATGSSGSVEGTVGVMRSGAVKPFVKAKVKCRYDSAVVGFWSAQTPLQFVLMVPQGSGSTKRWLVIDMPTCIIVGKPAHPNGDRELIEFELHGQLTTTAGAVVTDLALSPGIVALG